MKASLCFIAAPFVTFIHGFTVPGHSFSHRSGNWMLTKRPLETSLFTKKKKKGSSPSGKGFAAVKEEPQAPTAAAAHKAEATARGLLVARFEMEAKQRAKKNASSSSPTAAAEITLESAKVVKAAAPPAWTDPKKAEATARSLLAARFEMEAKQRTKNHAAATTEIVLEQAEADQQANVAAAVEAVLEMEREKAAAIRAGTAKASAQKAEATARALLTTRLDMENKMRAAVPTVEAKVPKEAEPVAEVAEPEPKPEVEESEAKAVAAIAEPEPESELEEVKAEVVWSLETVAEPEPEQEQPGAKATVGPSVSALVAINQETIEFTSGLIGGAIGFSFGGPVLAAIVASVANYFSRKQDESYANVIQSISRTTIEAFNAVARSEAKLQILKKSKQALEGTLESLKKSDGVDPEAIKQVEDTLVKVTAKLAELNEELDPVGAGLVALKAIGDLIEKIFDAAGEVNREYELTERATSSIKEAVEKTKSGLN